jgi:hypothetical protein
MLFFPRSRQVIAAFGITLALAGGAYQCATLHRTMAPSNCGNAKIEALTGLQQYGEAIPRANESLVRLQGTLFDGYRSQVYISRRNQEGTRTVTVGHRGLHPGGRDFLAHSKQSRHHRRSGRPCADVRTKETNYQSRDPNLWFT